MACITGIGGIFFKSPDPKALSAWYRNVLGFEIEAWNGARLSREPASRPPCQVWAPFPSATDYFAPSNGEFMINFAVDDMDGMIASLESKGVEVLKREESDPTGRFAWIMDPDGRKIELWQPKR